jgi:hypothetical protein
MTEKVTVDKAKELVKLFGNFYTKEQFNDPTVTRVSIPVMGHYNKQTGELSPWGITPSSEDKGASSW